MKRPCLGIGGQPCPALVDAPASRCPVHARVIDRARGTSAERGYGSAWQRLSARVLARDGHQCQLRRSGCTGTATTVDHIFPKSKGGTDHESNLVAACRPCNSGKRDR